MIPQPFADRYPERTPFISPYEYTTETFRAGRLFRPATKTAPNGADGGIQVRSQQ